MPDLVSKNVAPWATPFTLYLVNTTATKYLWLKGAYVDRFSVRCDIEDVVMVDMDMVGLQTGTTTLTGAIPADPTGAAAVPLSYVDVTVTKDVTVINDWLSCSFEVNKNFIRRLTASTGGTRALETVARDHSLRINRDMDDATALDEYTDISNDTAHTMIFQVANHDNSARWNVTVAAAKTTNVDLNLLEPEQLCTKDITYEGSSLTFGTS